MTVEELLTEAGQLSQEEQMRLLDGLVCLLRERRGSGTSVEALRGLGAHVWKGVDAQEYVRRERETWGG